MQLLKIISLLLFTVSYKAIPHWKGQKFNFQKKNISVSGHPLDNIPQKYKQGIFLHNYFKNSLRE